MKQCVGLRCSVIPRLGALHGTLGAFLLSLHQPKYAGPDVSDVSPTRRPTGVGVFFASLIISAISAHAQLYPYPPSPAQPVITTPATTVIGNLTSWGNTSGSQLLDTGISAGAIVSGPATTVPNHLAVWGNATGTQLRDGGTLLFPGPPVTVCPSHKWFSSYPVVSQAFVCTQPASTDLSDIASLSINTTGSITAASLTTAGAVTAGSVTSATLSLTDTSVTPSQTWMIYPSAMTGLGSVLRINNGTGDVFKIDTFGIPFMPSVVKGVVATSLGSVGPLGSHTTVQEWFEIRNSSGVIRYVAGF